MSHARLIRRLFIALFALIVILTAQSAAPVSAQSGTLSAEAVGSANVRSGPGVTFAQLATITSGTRYPVLGRAARVPWVFIDLGNGRGWVFNDLVKFAGGELNDAPLLPETTEGTLGVPTAQPSPQQAQPSQSVVLTTPGIPTLTLAPTSTLAATATAATNVFAEALGETNLRYGPGTEFPRVGVLTQGARYPVLRRHTQFNWIEIAVGAVPGGRAWVYKDAVKVIGNLNSVPSTSASNFGYPSLTPTPNQVVTAPAPWAAAQPPTPDTKLLRLGNSLFSYLLNSKFEPNSPRQAGAFLMDLKSGAAVSLAPGVAFSGMSLIKIPILVEAYRKLDNPPQDTLANELARMMICSDNSATNAMLGFAGNGDMVAGSRAVTETLTALGLTHTFITSPIRIDPRATNVPVGTIQTGIDQKSADPDPFNQATPQDLGYLLSSVYQCALDGTGPLPTTFGGQFTMTECRQMVRLLSSDKIGVMIEAGVPPGVQVAHKHGWVDQTLGDAGIVFTPGGDFVLVVMMWERPVLVWPNEFPRVSEIARQVYNAYNPTAPNNAIHQSTIPETCTLPDQLMQDLQALDLPPIR